MVRLPLVYGCHLDTLLGLIDMNRGDHARMMEELVDTAVVNVGRMEGEAGTGHARVSHGGRCFFSCVD